MLFTCHGYRQKVAMRESKTAYPILNPEEVARVPLILEGFVIANGVPVSAAQRSPVDGGFCQLWKGRVRVENVLQGRVKDRVVDIFYFLGDIPGSGRRILFRSGERHILFLRWDGPNLRTTDDRSANACLLKVLTGPHTNFTRAPGISINEAIMQLVLTRGNGVPDKQMIEAIEDSKYSRFVAEAQVIRTLQRVVRAETPIVREAACAQLVRLGHPCGAGSQTPTVRIENLTHPGTGGIFLPGDRLRTTLTGAANLPVYRSGIGQLGMTDGNGRFTRAESVRLSEARNRTDVWMVGTEEMSAAITYVQAKQGGTGEIVTTPIGNPRDQYGMGLSAISVSGQTVITYSAMLLDYRTSLYYDAEEQDTLYEDGTPVKTGKISGTASVHQLWETKVQSWKNYNLQASHAALAAFQNGNFVNPLKFSRGSCYRSRSTCQIVPLDGPAHLPKASLLLGTTGADQSAVPQDIGGLKELDPKIKAAILDSALARGEETTDEGMIAAIDVIAVQREFGQDLLVKKLGEVADRETPRVRAEACAVLRKMGHPCGKRSRPAPSVIRPAVPKGKEKSVDVQAIERNRLNTAVPTYLVFAHFLLMASEMKQEKLTAAFRLEWMSLRERTTLKREASALTRDLALLDTKAKRVTVSFRRAGALASAEGRPLPPVPTEIYRLQAMRTATLVNHAVNLRAMLELKSAITFEGLLASQFAP